MLDIQHLRVSYGITEVLRDVTFTVPQHKIVALLGGNGSGKTTLLNTLIGLVRPAAGSVKFEVSNARGLRRTRSSGAESHRCLRAARSGPA